MLLDRAAPGDREKTRTLLSEALEMAYRPRTFHQAMRRLHR